MKETPYDSRVALDLRGFRVQDAVQAVEKLIDNAVRANISAVQILHGKGTGALREAIHTHLAESSAVEEFSSPQVNPSGDLYTPRVACYAMPTRLRSTHSEVSSASTRARSSGHCHNARSRVSTVGLGTNKLSAASMRSSASMSCTVRYRPPDRSAIWRRSGTFGAHFGVFQHQFADREGAGVHSKRGLTSQCAYFVGIRSFRQCANVRGIAAVA